MITQNVSRSQERYQKGFTLIEMLVVIAIIALLAAILVPAVTKSLARAKSITCASNLRQMGLAFQMYTMDSQNRFNRLPAPAPTGGDPWFVAISPFLQKEAGNASDLSDVYRCQVYASLRSDLQGSTAWDQQSGEGKYYDPKLGQLRGFRHGKGGNFLFVDGHVSFLTLSTIEDVLK